VFVSVGRSNFEFAIGLADIFTRISVFQYRLT